MPHGYNGLVANIQDVAKRAGVSPTTAKRAINHPDQLAPKTLAKVQQAIAELQYEPDQRAAALRSGHNKTIGLIVGSIVEPFFASLTRTISHEVHERGYGLLVADSEYRSDLELVHLKHFYGHRVAGLLLRSGYGDPNLEYLARMQRGGTAVVEIDHYYPHSPFARVMLDGAGAVEMGIDYLMSLGHKRIAPIGDYHPLLNPDERSQAFLRIMHARGLPVPDRYRVAISSVTEEAYDATKTIMCQAEPPTALFALTGSIAIGAYQALQELGITIPAEVSLLTFDNYPWTTLVRPQIDVLEQPISALAKTAVNVLFENMTHNPPRHDSRHIGHSHSGHSHSGHSHSGHNHSGDSRSGHNHSGDSRSGHNHSGHSHSGHGRHDNHKNDPSGQNSDQNAHQTSQDHRLSATLIKRGSCRALAP